MDTHIRVSLNQDYRFSVEILNFHGPGVHLEVLSVGAAGVGGFVGVARVGRDGVRHPFWRVAEGVNDAER